MGRKSKLKSILGELTGKSEAAIAAESLMAAEKENGRSISIAEASIKDDFCNYSYENVGGKSTGWPHGVKGKGIIDNDLREAFAKLNVHLAVIDDVYKHSKIDIDDIDTMHNDNLALLFRVTGFKIRGGEENASVILIGHKCLSDNSRMELESPKTSIDDLSSYKWYNELRDAIHTCQQEVALYHYGKFTPIRIEDAEEENSKQSKLQFLPKEEQAESNVTDEEFHAAEQE